jgi:hypothetical protein
MNDEAIAAEHRRRINETLDKHSDVLARLDTNLTNLVSRQEEYSYLRQLDSMRIDLLETFKTRIETQVTTLQWVGGFLAAAFASFGAHISGLFGKH